MGATKKWRRICHREGNHEKTRAHCGGQKKTVRGHESEMGCEEKSGGQEKVGLLLFF